ncbi:hypothetical protein EGR_09079 [Echinococcus granulosus]|uniref:Uncharacterized protein n=1 Tax=Echinococcus granulosus TaxID=6210 RepID=W6URS0_ECHGR|nr:hypothetical protein EGR_09079 [Echinococcus granulosus]EUB56089.1 hypothetical protein EGR_09079 [Echinococcus granulosus]
MELKLLCARIIKRTVGEQYVIFNVKLNKVLPNIVVCELTTADSHQLLQSPSHHSQFLIFEFTSHRHHSYLVNEHWQLQSFLITFNLPPSHFYFTRQVKQLENFYPQKLIVIGDLKAKWKVVEGWIVGMDVLQTSISITTLIADVFVNREDMLKRKDVTFIKCLSFHLSVTAEFRSVSGHTVTWCKMSRPLHAKFAGPRLAAFCLFSHF